MMKHIQILHGRWPKILCIRSDENKVYERFWRSVPSNYANTSNFWIMNMLQQALYSWDDIIRQRDIFRYLWVLPERSNTTWRTPVARFSKKVEKFCVPLFLKWKEERNRTSTNWSTVQWRSEQKSWDSRPWIYGYIRCNVRCCENQKWTFVDMRKHELCHNYGLVSHRQSPFANLYSWKYHGGTCFFWAISCFGLSSLSSLHINSLNWWILWQIQVENGQLAILCIS